VVLVSGAFIALENRNPVMTHLDERIAREAPSLITSAVVVAEIWRGGIEAIYAARSSWE
jgi:hypothetical protein